METEKPNTADVRLSDQLGRTGENDVVGHKTLRRDDGTLYHEPLRRAEADEIMRRVRESEARREELMPDEPAAIEMFFQAWLRLKELGWREAIYCPKDGTVFDAIEAGSTGIHSCRYDGEWPEGAWWVSDAGDEWPASPALFRLRPNPQGNAPHDSARF